MKLTQLIFIVIVALVGAVAQANQTASRYVVAQSLQEFSLTGDDNCDRLSHMDSHFSMAVADVNALRLCRKTLTRLLVELFVRSNEEPADEHFVTMANLWIWDSLLDYWVSQLDYQDATVNVFVAAQNLSQAANYLKRGGGDLSTLVKVRVLWLTMHVLGQRGIDQAAYNNALQQLNKVHEMLAVDRESLSGEQRKSLSAYSAFWLGIASHKAAIFDTTATADRYAGYQYLREAHEVAPDAETSLAYLLSLYFEFIYSHAGNERANQYSQAQLFDNIELTAQKAGSDEVLIWNLVQQAQSEFYNIRSYQDASYQKVIELLDRIELISEKKSYRHYRVDAANLRIQLLIKFDQHEQAAAIVEAQMPMLDYLQDLAAQQSPELQLWAGRYLQLIDLIGRNLVVSGDSTQAKAFFSSLPMDVFPSAALNLSALYILDGQFKPALKVLAKVNAPEEQQISAIYRRNLTLAKHLSGDVEGAIDGLARGQNPSDVDIAYKVALYAYNEQTEAALALIKQHTGAGYGLLAQSLMKTMLAIYRPQPEQNQQGNVINTPTPLFSFITTPLWLTSDFEKSGIPYFQSTNLITQQNQATLVTGLKGDSLFGDAQLSADGAFAALSTANIITLWDNKTGLPFRRLTEASNVADMLFVNNDSQLLVGINNALNLWDLNTGEIIYSLPTNDYWKFRIVYNKSKNTVFYQNPYGKVVEVNVADPSDSVEIEAAEGGGLLTLDEQGMRLFYVKSVYGENNDLISSLFSYDLKNKTLLDELTLLSGQVNELWFARHNQQLLLSRDMSRSGDYSSSPQFQLALLDTLNGLKEERHFEFASRVELRGGDGSQLLFRTYDNEVVLDLNEKNIKPAAVEKGQRIYRLSEDQHIALVADQSSRALYIAQYPTLKKVAQIKQLESDPERAYYDEDKQRLMVTSGYNRLHLWDMSTGQEMQRKQRYPSFKPAYLNGQLLAIVDEVENYSPENNQWAVFENGEWQAKPLAIPQQILDGEIRDDLQVFETPSYLYFTSWGQYPNKTRRVWRTAHDFTQPELLPWRIDGEDIIGILEAQQLLITSTGKKVVLRDLQSQVIKYEIQKQDEYGNIEDLRVGWVDQQQEIIWVELADQLKGFDFTGAEKFSFDDEVGKLSQINGNKQQAQLIVTYDIAGSTLIRKINRQTGLVVRSDILFDRSAQQINHSSKGNYLLITTAQGSIDFWSLRANKIVFSMYLLPDDNWVVIDPKGRFDTNNPGELGFLAWRLPEQPMTAYPVDIFLRNFYEPRLIPRLLNNAVFADIPDLNTINRWQAQIAISEVVQNQSGKLDVTVDLRKADWPIADQARAYDLRLFRNGQQVAVYPQDHGEVILKNTKSSVVFRDIALPNMQPGEQLELSAMAFNSDGVKSRTATYRYTQESSLPAKPARAYLLNIGMNHYSDKNWNLAFAGNDARLLAESLGQILRRSGRYESVQQQQLITTEKKLVDKAAVKSALLSLKAGNGAGALAPSTPNDTIIMTWSGHGYVHDDGEFYLLSSQVGNNSRDMQQVLNGAVSATELSSWVEAIDAQRFILVIDACYSAAAVAVDEFKPGPMGNKGFGQLAWYKGMQILTASQANDVALESDLLEHGLLTYALVKDGLDAQQADYLPKDGIVTAREWLKYGQQRVPQVYRALKNGSELKASRGIKVVQMPVLEKVQSPALFDFYRGDQAMKMPLVHGDN